MAKQSSFLLAVLFIANPFMLLFYQNCSISPVAHAESQVEPAKVTKSPASEAKVQSFDKHIN